MKKQVFGIVLAVLAVAAGLTACNRSSSGSSSRQSGGITLRDGVLSVGMEIGYPPMEYYDTDGRTPIGFDVEMGKAIAEKLGLRAEFIDTGWDGIFVSLDTEKYDCIMSSVTITDARMNAHNFTKPYIGNAMTIVTLKGSPIQPQSPAELQGLGVSYQAETTAKFFMEKLVADGLRYTPYEYEKVMSCFDELQLGRVDVIVTDGVVALDYTTVQDSPFQITWLGEPDEFFGICIKKGNDALTQAIDRALDELFADGTMRRISMANLGVDMVSVTR